MTYRKATCARCGCGVVALEDEIRPLCVDCARTEKMERRRGNDRKGRREI